MNDSPHLKLANFVQQMKHDWDARAAENAMWFINTARPDQSETEFDDTGLTQVESFWPELLLACEGRAPETLRLLEIGCGIGRMTRHLAARFGEIIATDVSAAMIERARTRLAHLSNVRWLETSGVDFRALPDASVDVVFSVYVFQHVPDKAIIRANLHDAWRVLKPGGVIAFQSNGVEAAAYETFATDTWAGATFTAADIRALAQTLGAQLLGIYGANTGYCWTRLRKPEAISTINSVAAAAPQIEYYARADQAAERAIPAGGAEAVVALLFSGADRNVVDANNVKVHFGKQVVTPHYVGRPRLHFLPLLRERFGAFAAQDWLYVECALPPALPTNGDEGGNGGNRLDVQLQLPDGHLTNTVTLSLQAAQPRLPQIVMVRNTDDFGLELRTRGLKSQLRLQVDGLDETATTETVTVQVGDVRLPVQACRFVVAETSYIVECQLPADQVAGEFPLAVWFSALRSPFVKVRILAQ